MPVQELGGSLTLVTEGQLQLRQSLYPESIRKAITLPAYYQRFHDLRKEFAAFCPGHAPRPREGEGEGEEGEQEEGAVAGMLEALGLPEDAAADPALRRVNNLALVLQRLVGEGGGLHEAELVTLNLEPGIRSRSEQVSSGTSIIIITLPIIIFIIIFTSLLDCSCFCFHVIFW